MKCHLCGISSGSSLFAKGFQSSKVKIFDMANIHFVIFVAKYQNKEQRRSRQIRINPQMKNGKKKKIVVFFSSACIITLKLVRTGDVTILSTIWL